MSSGQRLALFGGSAVVVFLVIAVGLGWFNGSSPVSGSLIRPLVVRTSLQPSATHFGDLVVAQVAVDLDSTRVSASSLQLQPTFTPYTQNGLASITRSKAGDEETVLYTYDLQCVTDGCLPTSSKPLTVQFPTFGVLVRSGARTLRAEGAWPALSVATRLAPSDVARSKPDFRHAATLPPPHYDASPALSGFLTVAGALLAAGALVLIGLEVAALLARRRAEEAARRTPLQLALVYARQAARRPDPADRRKALGLLSEALAGAGDESLAGSADDAAWAEEPPSPERTLELADEAQPPDEVEVA